MGNFLVVVPSDRAAPETKDLFFAALGTAERLGWPRPSEVIESDWAFAASFPRLNGTGGKVATDRATGSWILTSGVWFHQDPLVSQAESALLCRFLEAGAFELAREMEGFFVVAIGDGRRGEIVLITDVIGSRHCFRRTHKAATLFSGSSLLLGSVADSTLDPVACQEFLNTGIVFEDRTCHQEVRKIGPATVLRVLPGSESKQRYWSSAEVASRPASRAQAVDAVWDSLTRAAKKIHGVYPNPVCDLTGGYDSRATVASFSGAAIRCATTVSGPPGSPDVEISAGLAKLLELPHAHDRGTELFSLDDLERSVELTDGEYDVLKYAEIRRWHLELASRFDIGVNGSFGEVARGYWWELLLPRVGARRPLDERKLASRRYAAQRFDAALFPPITRLDMVAHLAGVIARTNSGLGGFRNTFQMDHTYLRMRMQRWQGRIASSTNQIWPCISPFMFRSVLEDMLRAAPMERWRSLLTRKMLARYAPRIAAYPLEHGFPAEPASWRNIHKFTPLATYFGKKLLRATVPRVGPDHPGAGGSRRRVQLWKDERIRELLSLPKMKSGAVLEADRLRNFLGRSQQESFAFEEQWARLLTLEWALRRAEGARKELKPFRLSPANSV